MVDMSVRFENRGGVRAEAVRVSPEEAAVRLRKRMDSGLLWWAWSVLWVAWMCAMTVVKGFILMFIEYVLIVQLAGNLNAFFLVFFAGDAYLLYSLFRKTERRFGPFWKRSKGILVGRSFRHLTESTDRNSQTVVGVDAQRNVDYVKEPTRTRCSWEAHPPERPLPCAPSLHVPHWSMG